VIRGSSERSAAPSKDTLRRNLDSPNARLALSVDVLTTKALTRLREIVTAPAPEPEHPDLIRGSSEQSAAESLQEAAHSRDIPSEAAEALPADPGSLPEAAGAAEEAEAVVSESAEPPVVEGADETAAPETTAEPALLPEAPPAPETDSAA
jgi:hypothetical protein